MFLLYRESDPVCGRKYNRPEIRRGTIEFESDAVEVHSVFFDAHDAAAHLRATLRVVEEEGLADVKVLAHS